MTSLNLHNVKSIEVSLPCYLNSTDSWVTTLEVITDENHSVEILLYSKEPGPIKLVPACGPTSFDRGRFLALKSEAHAQD